MRFNLQFRSQFSGIMENFNTDDVRLPIRHWSQIGLYVVALLFNICLIAQVLTVGFAEFYSSEWWRVHTWLVRGYSGLSLVLLAGVFWISFPRRIRNLTISLPVLLGLQFLTIRLKSSLHLDVLHPLIGFTLVSVSATLIHRLHHTIPSSIEEESTH
jgi:Family of unknown function (DUF6220)